MRAERRREIERQMMEEQKARKKKGNGFFVILALLYLLTGGAFIYFLLKLNLLPAGYLYPGLAILAVVTLFNLPSMISRRGKKGRRVFASIISVLLIAGFSLGTYYLASTGGFFDAITERTVPTEDFLVQVRTADMPDSAEWDAMSEDAKKEYVAERLDGESLYTFNSTNSSYASAKAMLQQEMNVDYEFTDTAEDCVVDLLEGYCDYIFIPAAEYTALTGDEYYTERESMSTLYTIKVPRETVDRTKSVNVTKEPFNIMISGTDYDGYRSDVNMIATVNPVTHVVLLTSLPRDLYV